MTAGDDDDGAARARLVTESDIVLVPRPGRGEFRGCTVALGVRREPGFIYAIAPDPLHEGWLAVTRHGEGRSEVVVRVAQRRLEQHLCFLDDNGDLCLMPLTDEAGRRAGTLRPFTPAELSAFRASLVVDPLADERCRALGFRPLGELETAWREPPPSPHVLEELAARAQVEIPEAYRAFVLAVNGGHPLLGSLPSDEIEVEDIHFYAVGDEDQTFAIAHLAEHGVRKAIPFAATTNGDTVALVQSRKAFRVGCFSHEEEALTIIAPSLPAFINGLVEQLEEEEDDEDDEDDDD